MGMVVGTGGKTSQTLHHQRCQLPMRLLQEPAPQWISQLRHSLPFQLQLQIPLPP